MAIPPRINPAPDQPAPDAAPSPEAMARCTRLVVHFFGGAAPLYAARQIADRLEAGDHRMLAVWRRITCDLEDRLRPRQPRTGAAAGAPAAPPPWITTWTDACYEDLIDQPDPARNRSADGSGLVVGF